MAALLFVSFRDRFWEAQYAANAALAVSKQHFAVFEKSRFLDPFWAPFWSLWGALDAHVAHFGCQKFENEHQKSDQKKSFKKCFKKGLTGGNPIAP